MDPESRMYFYPEMRHGPNGFKVVHGICYVDGCPASPEKTEGLLKRIAHIRHTHYGISVSGKALCFDL